ncbi:MAG: hypothetical protein AAF720_12700 [Pseudomonadota bacterium]
MSITGARIGYNPYAYRLSGVADATNGLTEANREKREKTVKSIEEFSKVTNSGKIPTKADIDARLIQARTNIAEFDTRQTTTSLNGNSQNTQRKELINTPPVSPNSQNLFQPVKLQEGLRALEVLKDINRQLNGKATETSFGNLFGTDGNDTIIANSLNSINGGKGNDLIFAVDVGVIQGGAGNDTIAASNFRSVIGGDGNDTILAKNGTRVDGGRGNDAIDATSVERVELGRGNNSVTAKDVNSIDAGFQIV